MTNPVPSILDSPAISGCYLFPQRRIVVNPFVVQVEGIELLVLHRENDGLIDIYHAERNHAWAGGTHKRLVRFARGDHNLILAWNCDEYFAEIEAFVKGLPGGGPMESAAKRL